MRKVVANGPQDRLPKVKRAALAADGRAKEFLEGATLGRFKFKGDCKSVNWAGQIIVGVETSWAPVGCGSNRRVWPGRGSITARSISSAI